RIQRRKPGAATLRNTPVRVLAYDLLERDGEDLRGLPLQQRRAQLAEVIGALGDTRIQLSPDVPAGDWLQAATLREAARERGVE
ncbi:ATP-dependent DNA ligase, partial [Enterobacter hormaechei]